MRRALIIVGILIILVSGAGLIGWLMRGAIVSHFLVEACKERGFVCNVEGIQVSLDNLTLEKLAVTDLPGAKVATARLSADLDWPTLFQPQLVTITIDNDPKLALSYDGAAFSLGNVPFSTLLSGGSSSAPLPSINIEDTELTLNTPAGALSGLLSANGRLPETGSVTAALTPADLAQNGYSLALNKGNLDLSLSGDDIAGVVILDIAQARLPGQRIENATVTIDLDTISSPITNWTLLADLVEDERIGRASAVEVEGQAILSSQPDRFDQSALDLLSSISIDAKAGLSEVTERRAEGLSASILLRRDPSRNVFQLEAEAAFSEGSGPIGEIERGTLTVSGSVDTQFEALDLDGRIVTTGVAFKTREKQVFLQRFPVSDPFKAHREQFRNALDKGLDRFSASSDFTLIRSPDQTLTSSLNGPIAIKAASGANLLVTPNEAKPAVLIANDRVSVSGVVSIEGGGFPKATLFLRQAEIVEDDIIVQAGGIDVDAWEASGVTLDADLTDFYFENRGQRPLRANGNGRLLVDGPVMGLEITGGELFGSFNAVRSGQNWRVETQNQSCIGFDYQRLGLAADITLGAAALRLCPPKGRLLSTSSDGVSGTLDLGGMNIPITGNRFVGDFGLSEARFDWRVEDTISMDITAERLNFPAEIDARSVRVDARRPNLRLAFEPDLAIRASFGETKLSGELVPANIEIRTSELDGLVSLEGFQGSATSLDVRISDFRDDPLYQPFLGDLSAQFDGSDMAVSGPFRLASTGDLIGMSTANINLFSLSGSAGFDISELIFARRGLKPRQISERLRGLFTDAVGRLEGEADFILDRGQLSGTGQFTISDFGFSTSRLGPVAGIDGTITFDDLIEISTPPGQIISIAAMNPGLPLSNGEIKFQILQGREARLESASWPFAGGELSVAPSRWTIAGTQDTVNVIADRIQLKNLVDTLQIPDLEAEGTASGTFPIELRAGSAFVNNAQFKVDGEGGRLAYGGTALETAGGSNQVVNDAFRALQNLQYTVLEISLNGNLLGDVTLGALLIGQNPDVLAGSQFEFDISIDSKLAQLLQTGREVTNQGWLTEAVAKQIEENASNNSVPQD
ncbi:MAG: YdbH domain-containing protein [Pseudomonadota bacterium]